MSKLDDVTDEKPPASSRRCFLQPAPPPVPPPEDIDAVTFELGDDAYAVLSFALPEIELPPGLTSAESAVIEQLLAGKSSTEIALSRGTSPRTVNNQVAAVYAKLRVRSRAELVDLCVRGAADGDRRSGTDFLAVSADALSSAPHVAGMRR